MEIINGYVCHDCADVALAKRNIDPAHPKDGPVDAAGAQDKRANDYGPAVTFGGALAEASRTSPSVVTPVAELDAAARHEPERRGVDIRV